MRWALIALVVGACGGTAPPPVTGEEHDPRFVGLWIVEQPFHALYEATWYDFRADGTLITGHTTPESCTPHLERHCVTGSVGNCKTQTCTPETTCVFGEAWHSLDDATLVIDGECSDGVAREIVLGFTTDAAANTGGAQVDVVEVGGEPTWIHDNWEWSFRKCPAGTDETTCQ